jgi:lactoylglutathione lyase
VGGQGKAVLRKIDCVMIRVDDLDRAVAYYTRVFGLQRAWTRPTQVGLRMPETDAEIVLQTDPDIPGRIEVHYLVDDVAQAVTHFQANGCRVLVEPFEIEIGKCAVIEDPFGTPFNILDMTKGPLQP